LSATQQAIDFVKHLPITPLLKCHALNLQLRAKLSFPLSHCSLSLTWIQNSLDNLVTGKVREWLDQPPCATAHYFSLPAKELGLNLTLPSLLYEQCQATSMAILATSKDPKMKMLSKNTNVPSIENMVFEGKSKKQILSDIKNKQISEEKNKLVSLKMQSILYQSLYSILSIKELEAWGDRISLLVPSIANFARKALVRCLPTLSNLHRWGRSASNTCPHCNLLETEKHVLNNCSIAAAEGRYTWRHNAVLKYLASSLQPLLASGQSLFVDLPGYSSPGDLFYDVRPDIVLRTNDKVVVLELTCCYEQNMDKSKQYKEAKYANLQDKYKLGSEVNISYMSLEVSSLGFINSNGIKQFCKLSGLPPLTKETIYKLGEISLRCSFLIFCLRHKPWPTDITDPFII
jgi:hypothetical protein